MYPLSKSPTIYFVSIATIRGIIIYFGKFDLFLMLSKIKVKTTIDIVTRINWFIIILFYYIENHNSSRSRDFG